MEKIVGGSRIKKMPSIPIPNYKYKQFKYRAEELSGKMLDRNMTLFHLGVATGYRLQDLVCLTIGEIREALAIGYFSIQEKKQYNKWATDIKKFPNRSKKPPQKRVVEIKTNLKKILENYIKDKKDSSYAFESSKSSYKDHIRGQSYSAFLTKVGKDIGLKNISGHSLRKTYAKRYYDSHGDIEKVRIALGHESIEITKRYLGLYGEVYGEVAEIIDNLL
ncbi:MAG: tyrosine-type recombinase/integrase [Peptostreptococcaceae bacterium]